MLSCVKARIVLKVLLLGWKSQGLAADSSGAEDLGGLELGASGDKQDLQVQSCLGLMLETDVCEAECLPGTTPLF